MICYICEKEILEEEPMFYIGKDSKGEKIYRHDNDEHTQAVIDMFVLKSVRSKDLGEQVG